MEIAVLALVAGLASLTWLFYLLVAKLESGK